MTDSSLVDVIAKENLFQIVQKDFDHWPFVIKYFYWTSLSGSFSMCFDIKTPTWYLIN